MLVCPYETLLVLSVLVAVKQFKALMKQIRKMVLILFAFSMHFKQKRRSLRFNAVFKGVLTEVEQDFHILSVYSH